MSERERESWSYLPLHFLCDTFAPETQQGLSSTRKLWEICSTRSATLWNALNWERNRKSISGPLSLKRIYTICLCNKAKNDQKPSEKTVKLCAKKCKFLSIFPPALSLRYPRCRYAHYKPIKGVSHDSDIHIHILRTQRGNQSYSCMKWKARKTRKQSQLMIDDRLDFLTWPIESELKSKSTIGNCR